MALVGCGGSTPAPALTPAATPAPSPSFDPNAPWTLVFSDEFDTPGLPDGAKWAYEEGRIRNDEAQYYTRARAENARVENGMLVIEARKEEWQGAHYTSASLNTRNLAHFRYAKVEVRAKLPTGRGTWPAAWMLGTNISSVNWPTCGEVDIMENVGFDPLRIVFSIHTQAYNHTRGTQKSTSVTTTAPWEVFHVYGIEWTPQQIDFFLDGAKVFSFANEHTGITVWPFDADFYLLLNLAIGGTWGGQQGIDDSLFPHRYSIDYVRVYQKK
jgi:beta-glucanase (GH16 family)